jgi:hypothetical protein
MAMTGANQASLPHEPRNAFTAVLLSASLQLGMDTGRPIRLARRGVHRAHPLQQRRVGYGMGRRRPINPGIVDAGVKLARAGFDLLPARVLNPT